MDKHDFSTAALVRNILFCFLISVLLTGLCTGCRSHGGGSKSDPTAAAGTDAEGTPTSADESSASADQSGDGLLATITSPASDTTIAVGNTVAFQGTVSGGAGEVSYSWSFSGAAPDSADMSPGTVIFSVPGLYTVAFTATDTLGAGSTDKVTITVVPDGTPVAEIATPASNMTVVQGQSVSFQGSARGGDGALSYAWSFGGAAPASSQMNPGTVVFSSPGTYAVVFSVRDTDGDVSSDSVTITVSRSNSMPVATITAPAADTSILAGQSVLFQGSVSAGDGVPRYSWSFSGAAPDSTSLSPGYIVFSSIGIYTIVFTVTDLDGDSSSDTVTITVTRANSTPVATISSPASDMTILAGHSVNFTGAVSGGDGDITYSWSFSGAALDSSAQNPGTVVFQNTGRYTAVFTARDGDGETGSDSVTITVEEESSPTAAITSPSADVTITAGQSVAFQGSVSTGNGPMSCRWSFSGGAPDSRVEDPGTIRFASAGTYPVTFTATDRDGDTGSDTVTVTVAPSTNSWLCVDAGYSHTAAVKSDGTLWAWGNNTSGQLGDGTFAEKTMPTRIGDSADWTFLSAGYYHTLGLKQDGTLWAWGENANGQIGNSSSADAASPVQVVSGRQFSAISAGDFHSLALGTDGTLWAWGSNVKGQLGISSTSDSNVPLPIGSDSDWSTISAGSYHSVALKNDGSLWAWGFNSDGELGDGTRVDKSAPTRIGTDTDWIAVSAGAFHTVAIKRDGSLWTWGYNSNGQLGDGTRTARVLPARMGSDVTWVAVSAGSYHNTALKADGSLWAWGANASGQLGDGSATERLLSVRIGSTYDWASNASGVYHSAAFKNDGSLWTWGSNASGQIGDGTKVGRTSPVAVAGN